MSINVDRPEMDSDLSYEVYKMFQKQDVKGFAAALHEFFIKTQDDAMNAIMDELNRKAVDNQPKEEPIVCDNKIATFEFDINIGFLHGSNIESVKSVACMCGLDFTYCCIGGMLVRSYHCIAKGTLEQYENFRNKLSTFA